MAPAGLRTDPFLLGIASGEPWPDGFVIWTRLAVDPVAEDGLGGMPSRNVAVAWEVAEDARMRTVVARGVEHDRIETAHSVHVELKGLRPGREYFYRFRTGRHISPVGRTLTSPAPHETPAALAVAFASCAQFEHGYFTVHQRRPAHGERAAQGRADVHPGAAALSHRDDRRGAAPRVVRVRPARPRLITVHRKGRGCPACRAPLALLKAQP